MMKRQVNLPSFVIRDKAKREEAKREEARRRLINRLEALLQQS